MFRLLTPKAQRDKSRTLGDRPGRTRHVRDDADVERSEAGCCLGTNIRGWPCGSLKRGKGKEKEKAEAETLG